MLFSTLRQRLATTLLTTLFLGLTACGGAGEGGNLVGVTPPTSNAATIDGKQNNSTAETSSQAIEQSSSSNASINSTSATSSSFKPIASSAKSSVSPSSTPTATSSSSSSIIIFTPAASATYSSIAPPPSRPGTTTSQANTSSVSVAFTLTLLVYKIQTNSITLTWENSSTTQNGSYYEIYRNNQRIDALEPTTRFFADEGLNGYTEYEYTLYIIDSNGNRSAQSTPLRIRTLQIPGTSIGSSKSSVQSSISSASANSNSSATSSPATQSVTLSWSHPQFRENGSYLELNEIGGYELRYKKDNASNSFYLVIDGNKTLNYTLDLSNQSTVEIAVYDTNGLYSDFITLYPTP